MGYLHERAFYRLIYPIAHRPTFRVGGDRFQVIDLSEQGIRYLQPGPTVPTPGSAVAGLLLLETGERLEVAGKVVRVEPPYVALELTRGVPFGLMLEQQRYLQQRLIAWR
jgi:hypothetical protein